MKNLTLLLLAVLAFALRAEADSALILSKIIPLPGVKGRFDHFALDAKGKRLFVAALGNDTLEVIDLAAGQRLKSVTGMRMPTGVLYLPEQNEIVVANGSDGTVKFLDGADYALVKSIGALDDADNLRFDATHRHIYAGYGDGALAVIDAAKMKRIGDIPLKGHPESFQLATDNNQIFVNVPDTKQVAVVDRAQQKVVAEWHFEKVTANFPMALDETHRRLFIGGRQPPWLVIADAESGRLIKVHTISGDTDDLFYDAKRQRIYISCGAGFIDVVAQKDRDTYETLEQVPTRAGARTSFFSAELDRLFLAVPQRTGQDAEIRIYEFAK
ncbi:MAG: YncE family protein [Verrucomicrobiota bacterium]